MVLLAGFSVASAQNAYVIYPRPQEQTEGTERMRWSGKAFEVVCEEGIDRPTKARLLNILIAQGAEAPEDLDAMIDAIPAQPSGNNVSVFYLGLNGSGGAADRKATEKGLLREVFAKEGKFDRHLLSVSHSGNEGNHADFIILGEHTDAVFHGLASLEQILEQTAAEEVQEVTLYDYADQQSRGLVEGYYGYPYTMAVKADLMRFMMRYKMNTYLYGAKSDPYHSQYWKESYPKNLTDEQVKNGWMSQDMLRSICEVSQETKVNFIWAIHPGNDFTGSGSVISDIMGKFEKMYNLGVRQFAVFVDDVSVPSDAATHTLNANRLTELQRAIERKWNREGAAPADTVKPIHFVPQVYASSFVAEDVRRSFFRALSSTPENVVIYTTGWGVWSVPNSGDLNVVKDDLGRNVAWWWNYPCNDNADGQLYTMDMYSNFYDMPAVNSNAILPSALQNGLGIVANPMQEGEVSKIPLFSVADYAWNNKGFNNLKSWEAACEAVGGEECADALKFLAKYLRYNDPQELGSMIVQYKKTLNVGNPAPQKIQEEMDKVLEACVQLEKLENSNLPSDTLLYNDLKPWLLKLHQMALSVNELLAVASMDHQAEGKWEKFVPHVTAVESLDSDPTYTAFALEGMGSWISVSQRQAQPAELHLYPFVKFMKENAMTGFFEEAQTKPEKVTSLKESKGKPSEQKGVVAYTSATNTLEKNDYIGISLVEPTLLADIFVADTLAENYVVLLSANGKDWKRYTDKEEALEEHVKYVCVQNASEEPKTLRLTRKVLTMTLPEPTVCESATIPSGSIWDGHTADFLIDGDYSTFTCLNRNQVTGDCYQVKLAQPEKIGDVRICMGTVNDDYMKVGNVEVSADGKSWRKLRVKGSTVTDFTMTLPQVVKYSEEMSYCDFQGDNREAQYVRLKLKTANTSKWLRFYELEVNRATYLGKFLSPASDAVGNLQPNVTDAAAYTGMENAEESLLYQFQKLHYLKSVEIYQGLGNGVAEVEVTEDGDHWHALGTLAGGKQTFDLTDYALAKTLRITWKGQEVPEIYEIVEVADDSRVLEVTGIESLTAETEGAALEFADGKWTVLSAGGVRRLVISDLEGRLLLSHTVNGVKRLPLPVVNSQKGVLLVQVTEQDGSVSNFKVMVNAGR